jgi:IS5 family transposase
MEEALYEIPTLHQFARLSLLDAIPDETTLLNFRRKLPRQADTSKVELPALMERYSAGVSPPSESCGRASL